MGFLLGLVYYGLSFLVFAGGIVMMAFGDESLRRGGIHGGLKIVVQIIQFALIVSPFAITTWYYISDNAPLGGWLPIAGIVGAVVLFFIVSFGVEFLR